MADINPGDYAASVVEVLRAHLPDFDPEAADITAKAVEINGRRPQVRFECIVDDPGSARWRLRSRSVDRSKVRLAYYPVIPPGSDANRELERIVNDALRALEAGQ